MSVSAMLGLKGDLMKEDPYTPKVEQVEVEAVSCRNCTYFRVEGGEEICYYNPPLAVISNVHGTIGIRPTTDPDDFCAFWDQKFRRR